MKRGRATYRSVMKSHMYHWNVTGPHFLTVHELTETHYTDVIAERIRVLGKPAVINPPRSPGGARPMCPSLPRRCCVICCRTMCALAGTAEAAEVPVTADLATTRADFHEKAA